MREFLKGLGLDQETIDTIMAEHGKLLTASTEKIAELNGKVNDLTAENQDLKKVDAESLQNQINTLTTENENLKTQKSDYEKEKDGIEVDHALELAILNSKTIDPKALRAHLDTTKLKYNKEDKSIEGFAEQLEGIKGSHKYLFTAQATGGYQGRLDNPNSTVGLTGALKERFEQ